jgi:hypothetical protein
MFWFRKAAFALNTNGRSRRWRDAVGNSTRKFVCQRCPRANAQSRSAFMRIDHSMYRVMASAPFDRQFGAVFVSLQRSAVQIASFPALSFHSSPYSAAIYCSVASLQGTSSSPDHSAPQSYRSIPQPRWRFLPPHSDTLKTFRGALWRVANASEVLFSTLWHLAPHCSSSANCELSHFLSFSPSHHRIDAFRSRAMQSRQRSRLSPALWYRTTVLSRPPHLSSGRSSGSSVPTVDPAMRVVRLF